MKYVYTGYKTEKKKCFALFFVLYVKYVYTGYQTQKKNILLCFSVRERGIYWLSNRKEKKKWLAVIQRESFCRVCARRVRSRASCMRIQLVT